MLKWLLGLREADSPNGWKYSIWSGWPAFSNNVLIRLAGLEGKFHLGLPRLPCPLTSAWSCLNRPIITVKQWLAHLPFFNWMEDFKTWLEGHRNKKMWAQNESRYVRARVSEGDYSESRKKQREPEKLAEDLGGNCFHWPGLQLPWRWCSRFKPRVTLGKAWLESHMMQNSATTWFSQRFTSDENVAQNGTSSFWACQNQTWSLLLKNDVCLTYEKFLPCFLHQEAVTRKGYPLSTGSPGGGSHVCVGCCLPRAPLVLLCGCISA